MASSRVILFAEDQDDQATLIRFACARAGLGLSSYFIAHDGLEAASYLRRADLQGEKSALPCHVISDLHMPHMDGLELLSWIRAQPNLVELPVTLISAVPHPEYLKRAKSLRCQDFVEKPSKLETLTEFIRGIARLGI
jgi:CheY-like chemotaxis protein